MGVEMAKLERPKRFSAPQYQPILPIFQNSTLYFHRLKFSPVNINKNVISIIRISI